MKPIFALLTIFLSPITANQWVDPHDMNTNAKAKYKLKKSSSVSIIESDQSVDNLQELYSAHLKRLVSVLMKSAHFDRSDPSNYFGHIRFSLEPQQYEFLIDFAKENGISPEKLRKLDSIISESFKRSLVEDYLDKMQSFQVKLYSIIVNEHTLWFCGAMWILYIVYRLFKNDFSIGYISKYLLLVLFVMDFIQRYRNMIEEAEEHNLKVEYSAKCDIGKMTWTEWAKFVFTSEAENCERKVITPLDVFLNQVGKLIKVPMQALGTGMGDFGKNLFSKLPWGLNVIMWPMMLVFVLLFVSFIISLCFGGIQINFFGLQLKLGRSEVVQLAKLHRSLIEEVKIEDSSKGKVKSPKKKSVEKGARRKTLKKGSEENGKLSAERTESLDGEKSGEKCQLKETVEVASVE